MPSDGPELPVVAAGYTQPLGLEPVEAVFAGMPLDPAEHETTLTIETEAITVVEQMLDDDAMAIDDPVRMYLREIGKVHSIVMFPEGGRSTGDTVGEFKSGLYYLAKKRPDLELIPVCINNMNRILPRGEFLPVPLLSSVTFGPPIWLEANEPKNEFLARAREAVLRLREC